MKWTFIIWTYSLQSCNATTNFSETFQTNRVTVTENFSQNKQTVATCNLWLVDSSEKDIETFPVKMGSAHLHSGICGGDRIPSLKWHYIITEAPISVPYRLWLPRSIPYKNWCSHRNRRAILRGRKQATFLNLDYLRFEYDVCFGLEHKMASI